MTLLSYLFVVAAGSFSAVQAGANAQLQKSLDHPLMAALCIYGTSLIALLIAIPVTGVTGFAPSKAAQVPWWAWQKLAGHDYRAAADILGAYLIPAGQREEAINILNGDLGGVHRVMARRALEQLLR